MDNVKKYEYCSAERKHVICSPIFKSTAKRYLSKNLTYSFRKRAQGVCCSHNETIQGHSWKQNFREFETSVVRMVGTSIARMLKLPFAVKRNNLKLNKIGLDTTKFAVSISLPVFMFTFLSQMQNFLQ